jgi:3-deoxy-7-phosphoheptulonate synthase/chorismate mutase
LDTDTTTDLDALRAQVTEVDRRLVAPVNERLELVQRIWEHKRRNGLDRVDPDRERRLLELLAAGNAGPLTDEGLRELHAEVLALTKREMDR